MIKVPLTLPAQELCLVNSCRVLCIVFLFVDKEVEVFLLL